ncbi:MAG: hypothetical protein F4X97_01420 [Boseongicola sp. SB0662_bin_57]|nr:hypothetical protein [Boseongicola sp. SB0662_bin_57]
MPGTLAYARKGLAFGQPADIGKRRISSGINTERGSALRADRRREVRQGLCQVRKIFRQDIDGLMLAHCAMRRLIHGAAETVREDPDRLSFVHAVRVMRRRIINPGALSPRGPAGLIDEILEEHVVSSRRQVRPRVSGGR